MSPESPITVGIISEEEFKAGFHPRDYQVMAGLISRKPYSQIIKEMGIKLDTFKGYMKRIRDRMDPLHERTRRENICRAIVVSVWQGYSGGQELESTLRLTIKGSSGSFGDEESKILELIGVGLVGAELGDSLGNNSHELQGTVDRLALNLGLNIYGVYAFAAIRAKKQGNRI